MENLVHWTRAYSSIQVCRVGILPKKEQINVIDVATVNGLEVCSSGAVASHGYLLYDLSENKPASVNNRYENATCL